MCSIMGIIAKDGRDVYPQLLDMLFATRHRGEDGYGVAVGREPVRAQTLDGLPKRPLKGAAGVGSARRAFVGAGCPPYANGRQTRFLVHNGEIYNHDAFRATLPARFETSTDSEVAVHFLESHSVKQFMQRAAGDYAIAFLEGNAITAFRDPLGFRPLWLGESNDFVALASEPHALKKIDIPFPQPLQPGWLATLTAKGIATQPVHTLKNLFKPDKKISFAHLHQSFDRAVAERCAGVEKAAVLFSGGIDSSLLAKKICQLVPDTALFTVGLEDAPDVRQAEKAARTLDLPLVIRVVETDELQEHVFRVLRYLGQFDELQVQLAVPQFLACAAAKEAGYRVAFSGQGADELFCGYALFQDVYRSHGLAGVQRETLSQIANTWSRNLYREDIVFTRNGLDLRAPFLAPDFVAKALSYPAREKILSPNDNLRKHPLRKLARAEGLPASICNRKKRALQYGSGLGKLVGKIFRGNNAATRRATRSSPGR